jgi:PAS domain S-box-containing protein
MPADKGAGPGEPPDTLREGRTRKRRGVESEIELRRTSNLYRLLVESIVDYAIFVLDPQGRIASWNPGAERLKGYTQREIVGRHFSVFYGPEDLAAKKPERELELAERNGRVEDEGWRLRKDGTRFWANVVITALRDASGTTVGFAKITRDLTTRREAEEKQRELAAAEARRAESEHRNELLSKLNDRLNLQTEEHQTQTEELRSLSAELEETNERLMLTTREAQQATRAAQAAERRAWYLVQAGEILTASLDYEQTLQQLANVVVPELGDWCGVSVLDDDGKVRQVAVAHVDPKKVQLAQELNRRYPQDPHAKTGAANVIRTGKAELYPEIPNRMLTASAVDDEHLRLIKELGLKSAMVVPLTARGHTFGALSLVSDTSGRRYGHDDLTLATELARSASLAIDNARAHQSELAARRSAEAANRAKMQFLGVMSHELRTPLNAIAGYAELLKLGVRGPVTPEQEEDLDRIIRSERSLLALINNVLNYAKLEAGRVEVATERIAIHELLVDIEALVLPQLKAKGLKYENTGCDRAARAQGDADKVRQILLNLLSNAIKFTNKGGSIRVSCGVVNASVHLCVRDSGIGIPAGKLQLLFEPFVQVDPELTRVNEGTGLGLAISRDLARLMGGDIRVSSEEGTGSEFTLVLPKAPT